MNRQHIKQLLRTYDLAPSKRHGQNFLFDLSLIQQLIEFSAISNDEYVLEIGPGLGALTDKILELSKNSLFVEIDAGFCRILKDRFELLRDENRLIEADVLTLSGEELAQRLGTDRFVVVSNVPYSISSEIILWLFRNRQFVIRACLLLQREFAARIAAPPGSRTYGSLSVMRELYAQVSKGPVIPGDRFHPKAQVESMALSLEMRGTPLVSPLDHEVFESVVRAAFGQRRKTLLNSLSNSPTFGDKDCVREILDSVGIDPTRRAETLSVTEFAKITASLEQQRRT